jgi:hypothetical protein
MEHYNISNIKNFNLTFNEKSIPITIQKYNDLISDFFDCLIENIVLKNEKYFLFILQRGLETIKHCFKMIYMYSKNLDIAIYHSKKAFCYYVEFIGQIGDDNHTYLQLNSKDATLFVYKKTIFEIDIEFRKNFEMCEDGKQHMEIITNIIDIYHELIMSMMANVKNIYNTKETNFKYCIQRSCKIVDKLYVKNKEFQYNSKNLSVILYFIYAIKDPNIDNVKYSAICEYFVKKIKKKPITIEFLQKKLYMNECVVNLNNYTGLRFINWLFTK